jgi:hypothetical protein
MLFGAWRSLMDALSDCEEIISLSVAVWPHARSLHTDDSAPSIPTYWLASLGKNH